MVKYGLRFSKTDKGGNHRNAFHNACSKCSIKALVVDTDNYPAYIYLLKLTMETPEQFVESIQN